MSTPYSYRVMGHAQKKGGPPTSYSIRVHPHLARLIPPGTEFVPELTEDGILFRRVETISRPDPPSWAAPTHRD